MARTLFIGGDFNDAGGRPSSIAQSLHDEAVGGATTLLNGGVYDDLRMIAEKADAYDLIYWFANVPNDKPKLVPLLKQRNPACTLVTSKRNDGRYGLEGVLQHALRNKSNLVLEITKQDWGTGSPLYHGRVLDPLGNLYAESGDMRKIGEALRHRTQRLLTFTRASSRSAGPSDEAPENPEFFELVRCCAQRFSALVQGADAPAGRERFVGNASFRCGQGFPSFRGEERIYVSRRNIDKRSIGREGFVAVEPAALPVRYYGDEKPSVDTPVQLGLYGRYPRINYMLHGHVYVAGAPTTLHVVPCGALEEISEIARLLPDTGVRRAAINLRGHGSLIMGEDLAGLRGIEYVARPIPEPHRGYRAYIDSYTKAVAGRTAGCRAGLRSPDQESRGAAPGDGGNAHAERDTRNADAPKDGKRRDSARDARDDARKDTSNALIVTE